MFKNYSLYYFYVLLSLMVSVFFGMFSGSFILMWMVMELNLMCFLLGFYVIWGQLSIKMDAMIYYFVQSVSSLMILMLFLFSGGLMYEVLMIFFFVKMGLPPFHYWFITLMKFMNWELSFLLMTLQKFLPLYIFYQLMMYKGFLWLGIMLMIIFMFKSLEMFSMKVLMGYSSIIQTYWIMLSMTVSGLMFLGYMFSYFLNIIILVYMFILKNIIKVGDLFYLSFNFMYMFFFMMLSSSGLPLSMVFFLKLLIFEILEFKMILIIMILFSSLFVMLYLRMMYKSLMIQGSFNKNFSGGVYFSVLYLFLMYVFFMFFIPTYLFI